jgi:hypothetical protein
VTQNAIDALSDLTSSSFDEAANVTQNAIDAISFDGAVNAT